MFLLRRGDQSRKRASEDSWCQRRRQHPELLNCYCASSPLTPTSSSARCTRYIVCVCFISLKSRPQNNDDILRNRHRQQELIPSALIAFRKKTKEKEAHRLWTSRAPLSGYDASRFSACALHCFSSVIFSSFWRVPFSWVSWFHRNFIPKPWKSKVSFWSTGLVAMYLLLLKRPRPCDSSVNLSASPVVQPMAILFV